MRLHRLTLTDYRGVDHRDIEFADRGVTVVTGANEVGKSSLIEALDLLLEYKDRSASKDVKAVKPTHADVGAQVEAEISTGPYRFVYRKRFHKKPETVLTVLEPAREQLTGDEAHERVQTMLAQTMDTGLWRAQRVLQATSTTPVDLSDCDALSRALDLAAGRGDDGQSSTVNPALIEQIDAEYRRYFTGTGRPTGEWAAAISALADAEQQEARCRAAVDEVEQRLDTHTERSAQLAELEAARPAAERRAAAAQAAAELLAEIVDGLDTAEREAKDARLTAATAAAAAAERAALRDELTRREAAVAAAEAAVAEAAALTAPARAAAEAALADLESAEQSRIAATAAAESARAVTEALRRRDEHRRLTERLRRIDAAEADLAAVTAELSAITLTDSDVRRIRDADAKVRIARAAADLAATVVQVSAEADIELLIAGQPARLTAGETREFAVADAADLRAPGVLTARIIPGGSAADSHAELLAAQARLAELLSTAGVADLAAATELDARRRECRARADALRATLDGLRSGDHVDELRRRRAELDAECAASHDDLSLAAARAAETAAADALAAANRAVDTARRAADQAVAGRAACEQRSATTQERRTAARDERDAAAARLAAARSTTADEQLAAAAAAAASESQRAAARVTALQQQLAEAGPARVAEELRTARDAVDGLDRRIAELRQALRDITVELAVFGGEGRTSRLDEAATAAAHARSAHARTRDRALAVQTLRSVMGRHRDNTRARYVEPFRAEVQRLGRGVFGESFEVEVDSDLRIRSRTLDGRTVGYESLSGGAKEQLGIIARLAVAALVAADDTVPVLIDDALGFSDPGRLARMAEVFDLVGADGQVIVLTCSPERFAGIAAAHRIDLTPERHPDAKDADYLRKPILV